MDDLLTQVDDELKIKNKEVMDRVLDRRREVEQSIFDLPREIESSWLFNKGCGDWMYGRFMKLE